MIGDFNLWVLLGAALLNIIIGAIWYSPKLFGRVWADTTGMKESEITGGIGPYIGGFVNSFILAVGMASFLYMTDSQTFTDALIVGFIAWLGFFCTSHVSDVIWGIKALPNYLVQIGFGLISYLAVALFISYF